MILEYLAAAGAQAEPYALVVGSEETETPGIFRYGYISGGIGTMTPSSSGAVRYKTATISSLLTSDLLDFYFSMTGVANPGKNYWTRIEFIRNGVIEKSISANDTSYGVDVSGNPEWVASGIGWKMSNATYTVMVYY